MTKLFWHLDTDFHYKGQIQLRLKTFFTILLFGRTGASILLDAYWILKKAFLSSEIYAPSQDISYS